MTEGAVAAVTRPRVVAVAVGLLRACHAGPTALVVAISAALAVWSGRGAGGTVLVAATILSGQLGIGWLNDLVDRGRDAAAGRTGKPIVAGLVTPRAVRLALAVSVPVCVGLSLANGPAAATAHLVAVASAWSYDLGVKATVASPLPYAVSFGLLPAFVTLGLPGAPHPAAWAVLAGALLGVAAHFVNCVPDLDGDLRTGVRGVPQRVGRVGSLVLAGACAAAAAGTAAVALTAGSAARGIVAVGTLATLWPG